VDKKIQERENEKLKNTQVVPYSKILLTYADSKDKMLIAFGYFMAIATGVALPSFVFIFGDIINSFGGSDQDAELAAIKFSCLQMVLIGAGVWVSSYFYFSSLVVVAERLGRKTKVAYLRSLL
jgi:ATP-binding cassette subfamily B (MDR/TAP) protein 1